MPQTAEREESGPGTPGLRSDPQRTASRIEQLREYMDPNVLGPAGFCCTSADACRGSIQPGDRMFEGQLSHVGRHYDLSRDGRPLRVVVVGQEYGIAPYWSREDQGNVSIDERYEMIHNESGIRRRYYADSSHSGRNPHMRGTTSALRIIFDKGVGSAWDEEFLEDPQGDRFHIFDAFALVNVLLCSAGPVGRGIGRSTPVMRRNCLRHFSASLEVLEPTLLVLQGIGVQRWISPLLDETREVLPRYLSEARVAGGLALVCRFSHPAAHGPLRWGDRLDAPYLQEVVEPTLSLARTRA